MPHRYGKSRGYGRMHASPHRKRHLDRFAVLAELAAGGQTQTQTLADEATSMRYL